MIRINLLPVEKRRPERAPLPRYLVLAVTGAILGGGGVASALLLIAYLAVSHDVESLTVRKAALEEPVRRFEQLSQKLASLQTEIRAVDTAAPQPQKFEWWRAMNEIWHVTDPLQPRGLYFTKIEGVSGPQDTLQLIRTSGQQREGPDRGITLTCSSYHRDERLGTDFREMLMSREAFVKMMPALNPFHGFREGRVTPLDDLPEGVEEPEWKMDFTIIVTTPVTAAPVRR